MRRGIGNGDLVPPIATDQPPGPHVACCASP